MKGNPTILLVDDSENDTDLLRAAFTKAAFHPVLREIRNGREAIAYLQGDAPYANRNEFPLPTLMLVDLNMPVMDGLAVLAWARGHPRFKRLPIMVLTASMRVQDIDRAFDLGVNSFLVKPSTLEELVAMVRCLRDWIAINEIPSIPPE
jgi:CheY-like chemotaxis protein